MVRSNRFGNFRRLSVLGLIGACVVIAAACDPGYTNGVVGTGQAGWSGDGGPAVDATLGRPGHVLFDESGAYYVVDTEMCVIRKITPGHGISTVAGNGTCGDGGDGGPAVDAQIDPSLAGIGGGLALDPGGDLYLADSNNDRVRRVATDGTISTVADGIGTGPGAVFDVAVTSNGTMYVATGFGGVVSIGSDDIPTRVDDTVAVSVAVDSTGGVLVGGPDTVVRLGAEGDDTTEVAQLDGLPVALVSDEEGRVYSTIGNRVVRIDPDGALTTIAGSGVPDPADAVQQGDARTLALTPMGVAVTRNANLLVSSGHVVYRIALPASIGASETGSCEVDGVQPGANLSGRDLSGLDFAGCDLTGVTAIQTDFEGSDLSGAGIDTTIATTLRGADLSGTNLTGLDLSMTFMNDAILTDATIDHTVLTGWLEGVRSGGLIGEPSAVATGWRQVNGHLVGPGANLTGASLDGADLTGMDLAGVTLSGATLETADLSGARSGRVIGTPAVLPDDWVLRSGFLIGPGADLSGADLVSGNYAGLEFTDVDLSGAIANDASFAGADLSGAIIDDSVTTYFSGADLSNADLSNLNLSNVSMRAATLRAATIQDTTLTGDLDRIVSGELDGDPAALPSTWSVRNGYLVGPRADLSHADLSYADLSETNLAEADLSQAVMAGVRSGSVSGTPTALPDGWTLRSGYLVGPGADLSGETLMYADLSHVDFTGANLTGLDAPYVDFTGSDLSGATIDPSASTFFGYGDFSDTDLTGLDLSNSTLSFGSLHRTVIQDTILTGELFEVTSSDLIGTPAALAPGWVLVDGQLVYAP